MGILVKWTSKQVEIVMAFIQAPIEMDMYMDLPAGIVTKCVDSKSYIFKLPKNLYGPKQAG